MKITSVKPLSGYRVDVEFNDGEHGVVDLSDYAGIGVFEAWLKPGFFEQVSIAQSGALAWPGDLDLCPDAVYMRLTGKRPVELSLAAHM
jgi:hypothetical protein